MKMTNRVYGISGIEAINANFNANWESEPKNVDGELFATDVAWKHAFKVAANADGERVLGLKRLNEDKTVLTLEEMYNRLFDTKLTKKTAEDEAIKNLLSCKDVKCFGTTFATSPMNTQVTGTIQIATGINVLENAEIYMDTILSPYGSKKGKDMTTNGEEFRVTKAHYLYNIDINPTQYEKYADIGGEFTREDYEFFKEYSLENVTRISSRTRVGCENHFALFIEMKDGKTFTPNLAKYVRVIEEDKNVTYDFTLLRDTVEAIADKIESIEIYYNPASIVVTNTPENARVMDIVTRREL